MKQRVFAHCFIKVRNPLIYMGLRTFSESVTMSLSQIRTDIYPYSSIHFAPGDTDAPITPSIALIYLFGGLCKNTPVVISLDCSYIQVILCCFMQISYVGSAEADPFGNKISNESPVGKAALRQAIGAVINVDVPAGLLSYEILSIN